jgi:hypothetical protein
MYMHVPAMTFALFINLCMDSSNGGKKNQRVERNKITRQYVTKKKRIARASCDRAEHSCGWHPYLFLDFDFFKASLCARKLQLVKKAGCRITTRKARLIMLLLSFCKNFDAKEFFITAQRFLELRSL